MSLSDNDKAILERVGLACGAEFTVYVCSGCDKDDTTPCIAIDKTEPSFCLHAIEVREWGPLDV